MVLILNAFSWLKITVTFPLCSVCISSRSHAYLAYHHFSYFYILSIFVCICVHTCVCVCLTISQSFSQCMTAEQTYWRRMWCSVKRTSLQMPGKQDKSGIQVRVRATGAGMIWADPAVKLELMYVCTNVWRASDWCCFPLQGCEALQCCTVLHYSVFPAT